jgi:hypothetical protein
MVFWWVADDAVSGVAGLMALINMTMLKPPWNQTVAHL